MDRIRITGGSPLNGEVSASGAKNSALPILFSTLLAEGKHRFENVPFLKDIESTELLLKELGCISRRNENIFEVDVVSPKSLEANYDIVRKMRASILCLGPLLAKYGEAVVSLPGGCAIGSRPIDQHLEAFKALGAEIDVKSGYVHAKAKNGLKGARIVFDGVTVGGTENVLMAASLADGESVIENAAKEPEVVDLAFYLKSMGANIEGEGTSTITINGTKSLNPSSHRIIPDRIEVGTLLIAGAITKGSVRVTNCIPEHLNALINHLKQSGFEIDLTKDSVSLKSPKQFNAVDVSTAPHPGFPTDLQAQFMALMTQAHGTSVISENIFENRFMHVQELVRLKANISSRTRVAIVRGEPNQLEGAEVMATDLRASASLVLAGLAAKGDTVVNRIYHLDRGYEKLEEKLSGLGAKIVRIKT